LLATIALTLPVGSALTQELYQYQHLETRWATPENPTGLPGAGGEANGGRKGRPSVPLKAGDTIVLAEAHQSSGTVRRIWFTLSERSPRILRGLRLQFFWDDAATPAIDVPFGDFFGVALGQMTTFQNALFSSPEGHSFNCMIPMPFHKDMKVLLINESGADLARIFYDVDYTLGDAHGREMLYLHAYYNDENPTQLKQDFEVLPRIRGRGRFLGVTFGVQANREKYLDTWWGEGEVKIYLDGDMTNPTLNGTGTEDYIGTGWGMHVFSTPYQGSQLADEKNMRYGFYRWHIPDPIYFAKEIRITIQQIGWTLSSTPSAFYSLATPVYEAGPELSERKLLSEGLFERQDDWSSCAFFYLDSAENGLPPLQGAESRLQEVMKLTVPRAP
jgi:hypothetical protein